MRCRMGFPFSTFPMRGNEDPALLQCTLEALSNPSAILMGHLVVEGKSNRPRGNPFSDWVVPLLKAKLFSIKRLQVDRREIIVHPDAGSSHTLKDPITIL